MNVVIEQIEAKYLKQGDLYSDRDHKFWKGMIKKQAFSGMPLYLCMYPILDDDTIVWRILINPPEDAPLPKDAQQQFLPHLPPGARAR